MNKDFTYYYGRHADNKGSGVYHFSDSTKLFIMLDNNNNVEPKLYTLSCNSEFCNFVGLPIMLIDDGSGERKLLKDFSKDGFLETVDINHQLDNGSQLVMKMEFEKPMASKG